MSASILGHGGARIAGTPVRGWRAVLHAFDDRQPLLTRIGIAHLLLFVVLIALMPLDDRSVTGVNVWLKPAKFAISIGTYLLTMAWLLGELQRGRRLVLALAVLIAGAMCVEQLLITLQAARGTTSHYNVATPFDAWVFRTMGQAVILNTATIALVLLLFCLQRFPPARAAWGWGIRLGLLLFLAGSAEGMAMIMQRAHSVGAADGGAGLWLLAWRTDVGDLRIAHFVGIHAIQVLPIAGAVLDRWPLRTGGRVLAVWLCALAYGALGGIAFAVAMRGSPGVLGLLG